jgi:serine/threonine-protein kinase
MDAARWRAIRSLFDELVELSDEHRQRRLDEIGAADADLRSAVAELLRADAAASGRLASLDGAFRLRADDSPVASQDPIGLTGQTLSHFRILELIGAGGMGAVYRAEDTRLGRPVALKLPLPAQLLDRSGRNRFVREARAVAALTHPNICEVHETGEAGGHLYLAMPLYPGETLRERLARDGALSEAMAVEIARQVARGLGAAHRAGIVHRDLKPANVMILPDGTVKLLDFGVAKMHDASVTATGGRLGTVAYMAPEQVRGETLDARTDLWALGVMLYQMLTGDSPFTGRSDISIAHAILHGSPPPLPRSRPVSPALADMVFRLLEREPSRRVATAEAVEAGLAPEALARRGGMWRAVRRRSLRVARAPALAGVAALIGVAGLVLTVERPAAGTRPGDVGSADARSADAIALDLYERGRDYETRNLFPEDLQNAGALYRRAIERDSTFALARARYAITEIRRHRSDEAFEEAGREAHAAVAQNPRLGDAHFAIGLYWDRKGDTARARAAYERARSRLPESGEVALAIALIHLRAGRWIDAVGELERARELTPRDLAPVRFLALTYARLRRYEEAAAAWELLTTRIPDDYMSLLIKGYVHIRWRGKADTLAAVLQRIPSDWNVGGMRTYSSFAVARIERRPASALPLLDSAGWFIAADPYTYRPVHLLRAQLFDDLGDSAAARDSYARLRRLVDDTLAVRPDDPRLHIALGWAHAGLGSRDDAVAAARRAMALLSADSNAFDGIPFMGAAAEVFARAGDAGAAVQLLDSLLRMPAGREASVALLRADPTWDPIRSDPRFAALLDRYD